MSSLKYIGMDVHKETISLAVMNGTGKLLMESIIETKASTILQFFAGLRGNLRVTFEEGTWAAWLYDLLQAHVTEIVVCNPRKNALLKDGNKSDRYVKTVQEILRHQNLKTTLEIYAKSMTEDKLEAQGMFLEQLFSRKLKSAREVSR